MSPTQKHSYYGGFHILHDEADARDFPGRSPIRAKAFNYKLIKSTT
jgi:hypothetical protein